MKGFIVIIEEQRECRTDASTYVSPVVHTSFAKAQEELNESVETAKTDSDSEFGWLADAFLNHPEDIKQQEISPRHILFRDKVGGDRIEFSINEVAIEA